jgi:acyl dehydratase
MDDDHARTRGFDGIIAHGMFTMAHLTTCITGWLGDPSGLVHTKVSFRAAVKPGDEMVAGGEVVSVDPEARTAKLDVWVTVQRDGTKEYPVKRSHAEVRLG